MTEAFLGGGAIQLQGELRGKQRHQSHGQSHGAALAGGKSTGIMLSLNGKVRPHPAAAPPPLLVAQNSVSAYRLQSHLSGPGELAIL